MKNSRQWTQGTRAKNMDQQGKISTLVRRNVPNSRTSDNVAIGTNRPRQRVNMPTFTHCHSQVAETLRNTNMFNARNVAQGRSATSPGTCHGNTLGQSTGRSHMIRACPRLQHTHTNTASGSISTRYGCVHGGILPPFCQTTKQPRHREHQKQQNRR